MRNTDRDRVKKRGRAKVTTIASLLVALTTSGCSPEQAAEEASSNSNYELVEYAKCAIMHYDNGRGTCWSVSGNAGTCGDTVSAYEGREGRRVAGYREFSGGVVVTFQDGGRTPLWTKAIDCEDPPVDPLEGDEPTASLPQGGVGVEPSPVEPASAN